MAKLKLITAMAIFGTIGICVRSIPLPSSALAMVRGIAGTAFLLLVLVLQRRGLDKAAVKKNLPVLLLSGAFIGINWILLFEAYRYTTVAVATLCYYLSPVIVILLSPLVLKERLTKVKVTCAALALGGMVLVSGVIQGGAAHVSVTGILFGVGAAAFYAAIVLLNKFIHGLGALETTIFQLAAAALVCIPYVFLTEDLSTVSLTAGQILLVVAVGIVHTGVAYWLYFSAVPHLGGQTLAIFSYVDPALAILLSAIVLREPMDFLSGVGAVLILGSTLLSELLSAKQSH